MRSQISVYPKCNRKNRVAHGKARLSENLLGKSKYRGSGTRKLRDAQTDKESSGKAEKKWSKERGRIISREDRLRARLPCLRGTRVRAKELARRLSLKVKLSRLPDYNNGLAGLSSDLRLVLRAAWSRQ